MLKTTAQIYAELGDIDNSAYNIPISDRQKIEKAITRGPSDLYTYEGMYKVILRKDKSALTYQDFLDLHICKYIFDRTKNLKSETISMMTCQIYAENLSEHINSYIESLTKYTDKNKAPADFTNAQEYFNKTREMIVKQIDQKNKKQIELFKNFEKLNDIKVAPPQAATPSIPNNSIPKRVTFKL